MKSLFEKCSHHYVKTFFTPHFFIWLCLSIICYNFSLNISSDASFAATQLASSPVNDILLDSLPRFDTKFIHTDVTQIYAMYRAPLIILLLPFAPFALMSLSILIITRSAFILMTHLGPPIGQIPPISNATFGGDLFFSGHTAFPFLLALVFFQIKPLRYFFFFMSLLLGSSALLGHYHYTIDVLSAPYFAFTTYYICKYLFEDANSYREGFIKILNRL